MSDAAKARDEKGATDDHAKGSRRVWLEKSRQTRIKKLEDKNHAYEPAKPGVDGRGTIQQPEKKMRREAVGNDGKAFRKGRSPVGT